MSEAIIEPTPELSSKYFRIRKEIVYGFFLFVFFMEGYHLYDWWSYSNWPPHVGSNLAVIEKIQCRSVGKSPSRNERPSWMKSFQEWTIDRKKYIEEPQCAAIPYLRYEGSHTRHSFDIVDYEKEQRVARVVITFD